MKKGLLVLVLAWILCGCTAKDYETMSDVYPPEETPQAFAMHIDLPQDASVQTVGSESGKVIFCDGYEITMETIAGESMDATIKSMTGFQMDQLTVMKTQKGALACYSTVWSAATESGDQICRGVILDDGNYHYCLCMSAPAENAAQLQEQWQAIIASFSLS